MSLLETILDVVDCKRVVTELDGSCTWREAWSLHKLRVLVHKAMGPFS